MTLIVWVWNKNALAFAADSIWSVKHKTFIVNKLFEASDNDPIWVAVAWCSDFKNILNETIIKEFRKETRSKRCDTLEDYVNLFLDYLKTSEYINYWTREDIIKSIISWFHRILQSSIKNHIVELSWTDEFSNKSMDDKSAIIMNDWISLVKKWLSEIKQLLSDNQLRSQLEWLKNISTEKIEKIIKSDENLLNEIFCDIWTENYKLFLQVIKLTLWNDLFLKSSGLLQDSLLIFFWFWKKDFIPKILPITIYDKFEDSIMYSKDKLSVLEQGFIQPYAQWEDVLTSIFWIWDQTASRIMDLVSNNLKNNEELSKLWEEKLSDIKKIVVESIKEVRNESKYPLTAAVTLLSKAELWSVAERFVWIGSMKKRVNMWFETIWWPIDVAVVTKSDWFIWIKRKYYFDEKLNYNYFNKLNNNHENY